MYRVVVRIQGSEYNIVSKKSPDSMKEVAKYVDEEMRKVKDGNPKLNSVTTSIVASLNIADVLFDCSEAYNKLEEEANKLRECKNEPNEETKLEVDSLRSELEKKELDIIERDYNIEELNEKVKKQNSEIENLNKATEELRLELEKYKSEIASLNQIAKEANERAVTAEEMSSQWQNKAYDVQLKYAELESKLKNREGAL